jgi:hypothetical protein
MYYRAFQRSLTTGYLGENEVDIAEHRLEVDKTTELINAFLMQSFAKYAKGTKR